MIPDRFLIDPASASLIISLLRPTAHAPRTSHGRLRVPTFAAQELRLWNPMAPARIGEPSTRASLQPSQGGRVVELLGEPVEPLLIAAGDSDTMPLLQ
jgi:hypothetical protein